jgi:hypothetical protein
MNDGKTQCVIDTVITPSENNVNTISQCLDVDPSSGVKCSLTETNNLWINEQIDNYSLTDTGMVSRLLGQILLQVDEHGEAWYIDPTTKHRYYMKDGPAAYEMMRYFGLGITNADLDKVKAGNTAIVNSLKGRILLQVEAHGEAYWIHPETGEAHYLKDGAEAYSLMRFYSLGITNSDLNKIPIRPFVPIGIETE